MNDEVLKILIEVGNNTKEPQTALEELLYLFPVMSCCNQAENIFKNTKTGITFCNKCGKKRNNA